MLSLDEAVSIAVAASESSISIKIFFAGITVTGTVQDISGTVA